MTVQSHYFIAVPIGENVKEKIANWNKNENPTFKRFVHEADYHITLAFLGGIEQSLLDRLGILLAEVSKNQPSFSLKVDEIGFFGQKLAPSIFWAGIKKEEKLFELQKAVFETCLQLGINLDKRPYNPHITMARKYIGVSPYLDDQLKSSFQKSLKNELWNVSRFVIYQTHLKQTPKYEEIASFRLGTNN